MCIAGFTNALLVVEQLQDNVQQTGTRSTVYQLSVDRMAILMLNVDAAQRQVLRHMR